MLTDKDAADWFDRTIRAIEHDFPDPQHSTAPWATTAGRAPSTGVGGDPWKTGVLAVLLLAVRGIRTGD